MIAKGQLRNDTRTSAHRLALGHTRNPTTHETNTKHRRYRLWCAVARRPSRLTSRRGSRARWTAFLIDRYFYNTVTDRRGY